MKVNFNFRKAFSLICLFSLLINPFFICKLESKAQSTTEPLEVVVKDTSLNNDSISSSVLIFSTNNGKYHLKDSYPLGKQFDSIESISSNTIENYLILFNKLNISSAIYKKNPDKDSYFEVLSLRGINPESIFLQDLNNDGYLDCIVKSRGVNSVYINNEDSNFTQDISTDFDHLLNTIPEKDTDKPTLPLSFKYKNGEDGILKLESNNQNSSRNWNLSINATTVKLTLPNDTTCLSCE